ncbi:hypothetical protein CRUP_037341 [Coryphaenoides rupestris]|nr:hypothetical protein CRUP_037341 [Coryphaenoides rupestris]
MLLWSRTASRSTPTSRAGLLSSSSVSRRCAPLV